MNKFIAALKDIKAGLAAGVRVAKARRRRDAVARQVLEDFEQGLQQIAREKSNKS